MFRQLIQSLAAVGHPTELVQTRDGSRILLLPYGGRILGVFSPNNDDDNFLWTNPALSSAPAACAYYSSNQWHNSGGDRTWLAPEIEFFFPGFPDVKNYLQPRSLDPGSYVVDRKPSGLELVNRLVLTAFRSGETLEVEIRKSVAAAPNPLRLELDFGARRIEYAGYTQVTALQILKPGPQDATPVGLWNLTQLPHGGEMIVCTYFRTEPKTYFGELQPGQIETTGRHVRYRMQCPGIQKIGIRAVATTGRCGYRYQRAGKHTVVIRNFSVNPSGDYLDVPWLDHDTQAYSMQACSVNCEWGEFSEMEYHAPGIGRATGTANSRDISQLWCFRGSEAEITEIANMLLGTA